MSIFIKLNIKILVFSLFIFPSIAFAQMEVSSAKWNSVSSFKYCVSAKCETFKKIKLSVNAIEIGEDISVINADKKTEIAKFLVKSIKYGRQVKMCWIGDSEGMSRTYITVGGCSKN